MKFWFWILFVSFLVIILLVAFFGASAVIADQNQLSANEGRQVFYEAVVGAALYKQIIILIFSIVLAYLAAGFVLQGKT